ncbi:hypothetical protein BCR44DRAFT_1186281 [Catenaria anguillulae PL171]|uniref:Mediator of RNA polymerase II transcription subunit 6 n=1 Tax=Catenaria anguillulae PL171 TaxID=765915 RepID=A0A1Y2HH58_9FUNG|nr:hypothetical protein BCR44DRAFT_1186281 [Catenaria anguillulae PL171]
MAHLAPSDPAAAAAAAAGLPPQEDRSDILFHDPVFTKSIGNFFSDPGLVLQYHRHSGSAVFYDPACIGEQVFMQTRYNNTVLDPSKMAGTSFDLAWADFQNQCFHIIKQYRYADPTRQPTSMAAYALCNEQLIQAPDLHTLITSRLSNGLSNLRTAYTKMQDLVKFTPAQGYVWELPENPNVKKAQNINVPPAMDPSAVPGGGDAKSVATHSVAGGAAVASSVKGSVAAEGRGKTAGARSKGKSKSKLTHETELNVLRDRLINIIDQTAQREHVVLDPIQTEPDTPAADVATARTDDAQPNTSAAPAGGSQPPMRKKKVKRDRAERDRESDAGGSLGGESTATEAEVVECGFGNWMTVIMESI